MKKIVAILLSMAMAGSLTVTSMAAPEGDLLPSIETQTSSEVLEGEEPAGFSAEFKEDPARMYGLARTAETVSWSVSEGILTISGTGYMENYRVTTAGGVESSNAPWYGQAASITSIVIEEGVTSIGTFAFWGLDQVTNVTVGSTVETVGAGAFCNCKALTSIALPVTVSILEQGTFSNCNALTDVTAEGVEVIEAYAFESCGLTSYTVPAAVEEIDCLAFYNSAIENYMVAEGNDTYSAQDGVLYRDGGKTLCLYPAGKSITSYTVRDGVERVEKMAFFECEGLETATVPQSVQFVHPMAFPFATEVICNNTELKNYAGNGYRKMQEVSIEAERYYDLAYNVLDRVNAERAAVGLSPLVMNASLLDSAMKRSGETALFFSHTRPDGTMCFTMDPLMAAENIALNGGDVDKVADNVMNAWMDSPDHKANILSSSVTSIGVGCVKHNGIYYWVQAFGRTSDTESTAQPENDTVQQQVCLSLESFGDATPSIDKMYDVQPGSYAFEPVISLADKSPAVGASTTASVYIVNPGYTLGSAKLCGFETDGPIWDTKDGSVATIDGNGSIAVHTMGDTIISAKMKYYDVQTPLVIGTRRIYGKDRYKTSFAIANTLKETLGVEKFPAVVVATGKNYPDALSGSYLASVKKAPILLVDTASEENTAQVVSYIKENMEPTGTVYILGGTGVVEEVLADSLKQELEGCSVERLSGKSRYETNLEILKEAGATGTDLLVCTGKNYADSLSASATGMPILLVSGDSLTEAQITSIEAISPGRIYIIGGSGAVSTKMETALKSFAQTERVSGPDRHATSTMVANTFFDAPSAAALAYSQNFPDGLCGGVLAEQLNAPLILTFQAGGVYAEYYAEEMDLSSGVVFGGKILISDELVRTILELSADETIVEVKE